MTVLFLLVATGIVALIAVPAAAQSGELTDDVTEGIHQVRQWVAEAAYGCLATYGISSSRPPGF